MATMDTQPALPLPAGLQEQFHRLEQRLWWIDCLLAVCGSAIGLALSYLLLFLCDRWGDTPRAVRTLLTLLGLATTAFFAWQWIHAWILHRRDHRHLARLVQNHYHRLGDRLLGIIELAHPSAPAPLVSPALCRAAIRQVADEAVQFDFRLAVSLRKPRFYALAAALLLLLGFLPAVLVPEAGFNTLQRWLKPAAHVSRFTFVQLDQLPPHLVVPHGEPFEIAVHARFHPFWQPRSASCAWSGQPELAVPITGDPIVFTLPGQTKTARLTLRIGDVTRELAVEPLLRPALKSLIAHIELPDYLQLPPQEHPITSGTLRTVEGARLRFSGRASRPLASAELSLQPAPPAQPPTLSVTNHLFSSTPVALTTTNQAVFTWRDIHSLTSATPWRLALHPQPDQPPEVLCPDQPAAVAILEEEILPLRAVARDDFGLKEVSFHWECRPRQSTNTLSQGVRPLTPPISPTNHLDATLPFSPAAWRLPPDSVVTLHARAHDFLPGRPPTLSTPFRIFILSREEHARLIQQELERTQAELEDLARRQESLHDQTRDTRRGQPHPLDSDEAARRLADQAQDQSSLADQLARLSHRLNDTLKEALRNPSLSTDLLQDWAQHADTMQRLAQNQMPIAAQTLAQAQRQPDQRAEPLDQALDQQEQILKQLSALQKELGPSLDRLLAHTLAQRLRRIAQHQAQLRTRLQTLLPETIGARPADLPDPLRHSLQGLQHDQHQAGLDSQQLQNEIQRFYDRTQEPPYATVASEMETNKASAALQRLAEWIDQNITSLAMTETVRWESHFNRWAQLLEKHQEQTGQSQGGGGSLSEAAIRRLLALLRLRQQEQNLREHTQLLDREKESLRNYREDAILLSIRQTYLARDAHTLQQSGPNRFLPQVRHAMTEADQFLRRPQTDQPVLAAQTDAINLLEAELTDMLQNTPAAQGGAIAALMRALGMGSGPSAGGSFAGGSPSQPTRDVPGTTSTPDPDKRDTTAKTIGRSLRPVPAEYRQALQHFQRAVEKLQPALQP